MAVATPFLDIAAEDVLRLLLMQVVGEELLALVEKLQIFHGTNLRVAGGPDVHYLAVRLEILRQVQSGRLHCERLAYLPLFRAKIID